MERNPDTLLPWPPSLSHHNPRPPPPRLGHMTSGFQSGLGRLGSGRFPAACGGGLEGAAETLELQRRLVLQWGGGGVGGGGVGRSP